MSTNVCSLSENEICGPFKTLEDVMNWKPSFKRKHFTHDLQKRIIVPNIPKTLVCHDMNGGYLEDSHLQGVKNDNYYYFIHWSILDIFVYFSHHLVTIPPCGWISAAHKNGVQILGTFITEWDAGAEICDHFLSDEKSIHDLCTQLVQMAIFYNFDGWLINIENKLKQTQVYHLELFVKYLTNEMHREKPDSVVIWYDSVIDTGELVWQNGLNESNRNFFDLSDGIFLNYNWTDEHLEKSVMLSGSRKADVYVGADVFGRGCPGGGGFSTNIAVESARRFGLSVAIFAPGWVHQYLEGQNFTENQFKFWDSMAEFFSVHTTKSTLYSSSFCPGFGKKMYRKGKIVSDEPWFNLALQEPQPTYSVTQCSNAKSCISLCTEDAYDGGGCLQFSFVPSGDGSSDIQFLSTHIRLKSNYLIRYTFKSLDQSSFTLQLTMNSFGFPYVINLMESFTPNNDSSTKDYSSVNEYPSEKKNEEQFDDVEIEENDSSWETRYYILKSDKYLNHVIEKVSARITPNAHVPKMHILLGKFEILPIDKFEENVLKIWDFDVVKPIKNELYTNCILEWKHNSHVNSWDLYYKINGQEVYINTTCQSFFTIRNLKLDHVNATVGSKFIVEFILRPLCNGRKFFKHLSSQIQYYLTQDCFE